MMDKKQKEILNSFVIEDVVKYLVKNMKKIELAREVASLRLAINTSILITPIMNGLKYIKKTKKKVKGDNDE